MIFNILESRLIDILLVGVAIYFVFPGLFKRKNREANAPSANHKATFYKKDSSHQNEDKKGEYIDYEEIK
jgi:hypothetical protein